MNALVPGGVLDLLLLALLLALQVLLLLLFAVIVAGVKAQEPDAPPELPTPHPDPIVKMPGKRHPNAVVCSKCWSDGAVARIIVNSRHQSIRGKTLECL